MEMNEMNVDLLKDDMIIAAGHQANVREVVEEMILDRLGFQPTLQESTEEDEYLVYLHSDAYEDLEEEQLEQLQALRISDDPETSTEAICRFLGVKFRLIGKFVR